MSSAPHSAHVFIVVDPAQDYEESMHILGVYGSLEAAKYATKRLRRLRSDESQGFTESRMVEVWEVRGDTRVGGWTFRPRVTVAGMWTPIHDEQCPVRTLS